MTTKPYPTDLTDAQWAAVEPLIPPPAPRGRKREADLRQVVNAIRYLQAIGCKWRCLPTRFPNPSTVRHYYDTWRHGGLWERIESVLAAASSHAAVDSSDNHKIAKQHDETS
jgi:transposase